MDRKRGCDADDQGGRTAGNRGLRLERLLLTLPWQLVLAASILVLAGSLVLFGFGIEVCYISDVFLAGSAALFVLAVTLGIFAYISERATSHESSVPE